MQEGSQMGKAPEEAASFAQATERAGLSWAQGSRPGEGHDGLARAPRDTEEGRITRYRMGPRLSRF